MHSTGIEYTSADRAPTVLPELAELLPPLTGEQLLALEADLLAKPCQAQEIDGSLEAMQALVGGYIEAVTPFAESIAIVCNEEGKLRGLPYNRPLTDRTGAPYDILCGTFFIAGVDGEHFVSLTEEQIQRYKDLYDNVMVLTSEQPENQAEIVPEAAMPDFAVACQISFRFTHEDQENPGFPICGKCAVQRDCKVRPIERYQKSLPADVVQYVGIAQDEQERLLRLEGGRQVSLLAKYNFTEQDAKELCQRANVIKLRRYAENIA